MAIRLPSLFVVAILFAAALYAHELRRDIKALDVAAPIRQAATEKMSVSTTIEDYGTIVVFVALENIRLRPAPQRSVPFGQESKGTWLARFSVVPRLSPEDIASLIKNAKQRLDQINEAQKRNGAEVRGEPRIYRNLAHVVSDRYAYRIELPGNIPIDEADKQEIELFIKALASRLKTLDGKNSTDTIKSRILPPSAIP